MFDLKIPDTVFIIRQNRCHSITIMNDGHFILSCLPGAQYLSKAHIM